MNKTETKFNKNLSKILEMVENNEPKISICQFIGIKQDTLNLYFKKYNINYVGNQFRKGKTRLEQITHYTDYTEKGKFITSSSLRIKLIKQKVKEEKCEICNLDRWMDKPIPLELHHIDGNRFNNKLENLQVLCSNCHMQSHNYSNVKKPTKEKQNTETKIKYCGCGVVINSRSEKCTVCYKESLRKTKRPDYHQLLDEIKNLGYCGVGKKYKVSDNSIRKWVKFYEKNNKIPS